MRTIQLSMSEEYFRQSALREVRLLRKYLHIEGSGENLIVTKPIRREDVLGFYREYRASVRAPRVRVEKIIPEADPAKLRGLYFGQPDVNVVLNLIVRHCLYMDQILVVDPFLNLRLDDPENSPLARPEAWVKTMVNHGFFLTAISDWIAQGIVIVFPSPTVYDEELFERSLSLVPPTGLKVSPRQWKEFEEWVVSEMLVGEKPEHRTALLDVFERMGKKMDEEERERILAMAAQYEERNPIRFRRTEIPERFLREDGTYGEIIHFGSGVPIQLAQWVAELTGSHLIFDRRTTYETMVQNFPPMSAASQSVTELAIACQALEFPFLHNVSVGKALELRNQGYLQSFRKYLRELWGALSGYETPDELDAKVLAFSDRLQVEYDNLRKEWEEIRRNIIKSVAIDVAFGSIATAAIVSGSIDWRSGVIGVGVSATDATRRVIKEMKKYGESKRNPLYVLLELAR